MRDERTMRLAATALGVFAAGWGCAGCTKPVGPTPQPGTIAADVVHHEGIGNADIRVALDVADSNRGGSSDAPQHDRSIDSAGDAEVPAGAGPPTTAIWVHHPKPTSLQLRGSVGPLSWSADFAPQALTATAARFDVPAAVGPFLVKPMATGAWSLGANFVVQINEPRALYPYFDPKLSAPRRDDFSVPGPDGQSRTVRIRLPAGYDENNVATYPLLVLFDGQNVFDAQTATFGVAWELDEAIDASMAEARFQEVVVAAVDHGGAKRIQEYTPWPDAKYGGGGGQNHLAWIHTEVLPTLAKKYRLQPGPQARCLGGSSLGALMTLYAVGSHPEQWSCGLAMSGAWWWADLKVLSWLSTAPAAANHPKLWLDVGTVKDGLADTQAVRQKLLALGWQQEATLGYFEAVGADHSEKAWAARAPMALQYLFDPHDRAKPF